MSKTTQAEMTRVLCDLFDNDIVTTLDTLIKSVHQKEVSPDVRRHYRKALLKAARKIKVGRIS